MSSKDPFRLRFCLLGFFSFVFLYHGKLFLSRFPNSYVWTELMTNYQGGMCRRGLLGEIAYQAGSLVPAGYFLLSVQLALYLLFFVFVLNFPWGARNYASVLFLFSPATLLFPVYDPEAFARKDIEVLAAFVFSLLIAKQIRSRGWAVALVMLVYLVTALVTESALFYFPLAFAVLMSREPEESPAKQALLWSVCFLFLVLSLGMMAAMNFLSFSPDKMMESWRSLYPAAYAEKGAVAYLGMPLNQGLFMIWFHDLKNLGTFLGYLVAAALANIPLVFLLCSRKLGRVSPVMMVGILGAFLVMLGSFALVADWGRCIHLFTIHAFLFAWILIGDATQPTAASRGLQPGGRLVQAPLLCQYLLLFLYALTWKLAHFVLGGDSPFQPGLLFEWFS